MGASLSQQSARAAGGNEFDGGIPRTQRQVLIAVDGSPNSQKAFDFWSRVPGSEQDSIIFLNTLEVPNVMSGLLLSPSGTFDYDEYESQVRAVKRRSEMLRQMMMERCEKRNLTCKFVTQTGSPGATIVDAAKNFGVNVVVVGCRGNNGIRKTILGSVSDYVLQHSCRPVIVVPTSSQ